MKLALARSTVPVASSGRALVQRVSFNDMPLVFSGLRAETEVAYQSISNPGGTYMLPGLFLRSSGSPRLPRLLPGNTRLGRPSPADRQAGCLGSRADRVPRLLPGQTRIPPGNCCTNGVTVTSGEAATHPRRGRWLGVTTRRPSWEQVLRGAVYSRTENATGVTP